MKLFVSYSRRDGIVTTELLRNLEHHLQGVCSPFIHCLHGNDSRWQQAHLVGFGWSYSSRSCSAALCSVSRQATLVRRSEA